MPSDNANTAMTAALLFLCAAGAVISVPMSTLRVPPNGGGCHVTGISQMRPYTINIRCDTDCARPPKPLTVDDIAALDPKIASNIVSIRADLWHKECDGAGK